MSGRRFYGVCEFWRSANRRYYLRVPVCSGECKRRANCWNMESAKTESHKRRPIVAQTPKVFRGLHYIGYESGEGRVRQGGKGFEG